MKLRAFVGIAAGTLAASLASSPVRAQLNSFEFLAPPSTVPVGRSFTVRWVDVPVDGVHEGSTNITWYYSAQPDGADRKRMTTLFRDDFNGGLIRNWRPDGPFSGDWELGPDPTQRDRRVLRGRGNSPLLSAAPLADEDFVLSVLVRPAGVGNRHAIGVAIQKNGQGYEVRTEGNGIKVMRDGEVLEQSRAPRMRPSEWYWYDIGVRRKRKDVELRVRVLDEARRSVMATLDCDDCPSRSFQKGGLVALWGPADFREVFVDSWAARWVDDSRNVVEWDTSEVRDGEYYIVAELLDEKGTPRLAVSDYRVTVRQSSQAAN
jgi:hypothetical protein